MNRLKSRLFIVQVLLCDHEVINFVAEAKDSETAAFTWAGGVNEDRHLHWFTVSIRLLPHPSKELLSVGWVRTARFTRSPEKATAYTQPTEEKQSLGLGIPR